MVPGLFPFPATLDLSLKNTGLWVGALAIRADCPGGLSVVVSGQGNAKKHLTVFESQEFVEGGDPGVVWAGTRPEWWAIDGQVLYSVRSDLSVMAGLRWDHLSLNLGDPTDANGNPLNYDRSGVLLPGTTYHTALRYTSDLLSKLWIPYVGLEFVGSGYKMSLIGSPFASAQMQIPASQVLDFATFTGPFFAELLWNEGMTYSVSKPALFVEGDFQYDCIVASGLSVRLWCKASWMRLRAAGNWTNNFWGQVLSSFDNYPPDTEIDRAEHPATYTRSVLGGGFSAAWSF